MKTDNQRIVRLEVMVASMAVVLCVMMVALFSVSMYTMSLSGWNDFQDEQILVGMEATAESLSNHNKSLMILIETDQAYLVSINDLYEDIEWLHAEGGFLQYQLGTLNRWMMCEKSDIGCEE